jgi:hypothetical protein
VEFGWSEEDLTFRKEVRAFLDVELGDSWVGPTAVLGSAENVASAVASPPPSPSAVG